MDSRNIKNNHPILPIPRRSSAPTLLTLFVTTSWDNLHAFDHYRSFIWGSVTTVFLRLGDARGTSRLGDVVGTAMCPSKLNSFLTAFASFEQRLRFTLYLHDWRPPLYPPYTVWHILEYTLYECRKY